VVRYTVSGVVRLEGSTADINKRLEVNPKTKIPQILFTVYQHVFSSIYLLSSVLDTPYPPPDLLHPMQEKIQILPKTDAEEPTGPQQAEPAQPSPTIRSAATPSPATTGQTQQANIPVTSTAAN